MKTPSVRRKNKIKMHLVGELNHFLSYCATHLCKSTYMSPDVPVDSVLYYQMLLQLKMELSRRTVLIIEVRKKPTEYEHVGLTHMFCVFLFVIGKKGCVWVG